MAEQSERGRPKWVRAANARALSQLGMIGVKIDDDYIAIYDVAGTLYATSDVCTHAFAMLSDGFLEGHTVECPLHAACFDVRTGKGLVGLVNEDLRVYSVRRNGSDIEVEIWVSG